MLEGLNVEKQNVQKCPISLIFRTSVKQFLKSNISGFIGTVRLEMENFERVKIEITYTALLKFQHTESIL